MPRTQNSGQARTCVFNAGSCWRLGSLVATPVAVTVPVPMVSTSEIGGHLRRACRVNQDGMAGRLLTTHLKTGIVWSGRASRGALGPLFARAGPFWGLLIHAAGGDEVSTAQVSTLSSTAAKHRPLLLPSNSILEH
jgi:hypothetical protein